MLAIMTEPVFNNTQESCNNLQYLKDLLGDDEMAIHEIVMEIKKQWRDDCKELLEAVDENNVNEVKRLLHRIKSTFSPLGPNHILYQSVLKYGENYFIHNPSTLPMDGKYWRNFVQSLNGHMLPLKPSQS